MTAKPDTDTHNNYTPSLQIFSMLGAIITILHRLAARVLTVCLRPTTYLQMSKKRAPAPDPPLP